MPRTDADERRALRRRPLLAALLVASLVGGAPGARAQAPQVATAGAPAQISALGADVQRREAELGRVRAQLQAQEREAAQDAAGIEQLKAQPQTVARELELQRRLAAAQERADRLSGQAAQRRQLEAELRAARQRLMVACDRLLSDGVAQLPAADRLEVLRLRALQAEALSAAADPALPAALRAVGDEPQPDDPQLLRERADLLRDSADKVLREVRRLEQRAEEIQRRQRLRARAASVDEDLFAEQATSRRGGTSAEKARFGAGADTAAGAAPGPQGPRAPDAPPPTGSVSQPPPSRSGLDPATLDLLRRGEGSADPEARLLAIRRAQAELQRMATDLSRRAGTLDRRSEDLRRRK